MLAIGQLIEAKDGKKLAEGNTATLELTPRQAEELALGELDGRDLAVAAQHRRHGSKSDEATAPKERSNSIKVLKYGVQSRAYGVN